MKLVYGVGVNDADYPVQPCVNGKQVMCQSYRAWANMLKRCYSERHRYQAYIGVTVCDEWLSFMSFRKWWLEHHVDGFQLDKDMIGGGMMYSPDACIYVPQWINSFTLDSGSARGDLPIGVSYHKLYFKYQSHCSNPFGKLEHLGYFVDKGEACEAWMTRKLQIAAELKSKMDDVDKRIYPRIVEIIKNAK